MHLAIGDVAMCICTHVSSATVSEAPRTKVDAASAAIQCTACFEVDKGLTAAWARECEDLLLDVVPNLP